MGNLGFALLTYKGFKDQGFKIVNAFDNDLSKIGTFKNNFEIHHIDQLKSKVKEKGIRIAILTVPAKAAQEAVDHAIESGIKLILNFAPERLQVSDDVNLLNIDVAVELAKLTYYATKGERIMVLKKTVRLFK